jgi:hypothetical protein
MAKQRWTNEKIQQFIREGRGHGTGAHYQPWTKISDFSSMGRASRIQGIKTHRIHHLQSDNQLRALLIFEWCDKVIDIRESFPLLDVMEVIDKKDDLRFDKFKDKETGVPLILTTSFLLTVRDQDGKEVLMARSVKNATELSRGITIEKLEIERRYWQAKGADWKLITDKQIPKQYVKNIEWVRDTMLDQDKEDNRKEEQSIWLQNDLLKYPDLKLQDVLHAFDRKEGMQPGVGLFLFRYLIAKKHIRVDMYKGVQTSQKINDILR